MGHRHGIGAILTTAALAILLTGLAVVQFRWSTRVAAADAQREKESLESSASLFADRFENVVGNAQQFLQNDALTAFRRGSALTGIPKLAAEIYYLEFPDQGAPKTERLGADGLFAEAAKPDWIALPGCVPVVLAKPPALVSPVYDIETSESRSGAERHIVKTVTREPRRCFVARIDENYLRGTLFPQLIGQSFGATARNDYDFAVVSRSRPPVTVYGTTLTPDLRKTFFSPAPRSFFSFDRPAPRAGATSLFIQRVETVASGAREAPEFAGPGIWEMEIAHRGVPLAEAFESRRRNDLLLSAGVECLLLASIVFLTIGARRMQRLADTKLQFVAGVSHELRTPVSAIAMLSRNQADGLVTDPQKVKQYGALIHEQSRRLSEMLEQTLEYAGIRSGLRAPARETVDAGGLVRGIVDERREEIARAGIEVEIAVNPDLPPLTGDARLLRMAVDNLLCNALKHAGRGRWVGVRVEYAGEAGEMLVSVEDRGDGIDPRDRKEIFEPFRRGRAAVEAQIPGAGLGLSLVRSAAEAHRGSVTLESEPGRGSTFTMRLPV